jgi:hypothetical protein
MNIVQGQRQPYAPLRQYIIKKAGALELLWCSGPGGWENHNCRSLVWGSNHGIVIFTNTILKLVRDHTRMSQISHGCGWHLLGMLRRLRFDFHNSFGILRFTLLANIGTRDDN